MFSHSYVCNQLRIARDAMGRALDAVESDQVGKVEPTHCPHGHPRSACPSCSPVDDGAAELPAQAQQSPAAALLFRRLQDRVLTLEGSLKAFTERVEQLSRILVDIAPEACAKHDLFGF
jgi:hypothetical protein